MSDSAGIDHARATRLLRIALGLAICLVALMGTVVVAATPRGPGPAQVREIDASNVGLAAHAIVQQAVDSGALLAEPDDIDGHPAAAIMTAVYALLQKARNDDPSLALTDTSELMGPVPWNLSHPLRPRARHRRVTVTHTLRRFEHAVHVGTSRGFGMHRRHDHVLPAPRQRPDGVYVDPALPPLPTDASVAMVAIRAAMSKLGHPYVWAAAGPDTFDCSGLVRWAYGKAGVPLLHYTGFQWNEGRRVPAHDVLPGDLILFYKSLSHVGIYLGSGWMLNAPYTGQYVSVMPVHGKVAGIVRP
ncbi:MAG TPA: C40 family peptidase [Mycobacteriales bacterium]|nr:C40 family peptidase [Mycobacteriales bacterium]